MDGFVGKKTGEVMSCSQCMIQFPSGLCMCHSEGNGCRRVRLTQCHHEQLIGFHAKLVILFARHKHFMGGYHAITFLYLQKQTMRQRGRWKRRKYDAAAEEIKAQVGNT